MSVPDDGATGFPIAFREAVQVEKYYKMTERRSTLRSNVEQDTPTNPPDVGSREKPVGIPTRTVEQYNSSTTNRLREKVTGQPNTLYVRKIGHFDIKGICAGMTYTPEGSLVLCESRGSPVKMYTPKGHKVLDLQTPPGTKACNVDSTDTHIYVTDRKTESVLVFDHQGRLVNTNNISDVWYISGISISNNKVYITELGKSNVFEMDLSDRTTVSTQRMFATGVQLYCPLFVCASGDDIAISSIDNHCVHCMDSTGKIKYTFGTPFQAGNSPTQLDRPFGVRFDPRGRLFIADQLNHRVCVVYEDGQLIGHIDLLRDHKLKFPYTLTFDKDGNLLVACEKACRSNGRITKFEYTIT